MRLGYRNVYTFSRGQALAEYEDFMERPIQAGYVVSDGVYYRETKYKITKQGYEFAKSIL